VSATAGRDGDAIIADAAKGDSALVVGAVDPSDLGNPALALKALEEAPFVVSLEVRESAVTDRADVVFPVAAVVEKAGLFLDWEGRMRPFDETLESTGGLSDHRVLHRLAAELGVDLGTPDSRTTQAEIAQLGAFSGDRPAAPTADAGTAVSPGSGEAVLATWHYLLDDGRLQDGVEQLAGTRKDAVVRLSAGTASAIGATDGRQVAVSTATGTIRLPLVVTDMPDGVVWVPTKSPGSHVAETLGQAAGSVVKVAAEGSRS
jgi:NADH-quinone oxidoreductase subunit G